MVIFVAGVTVTTDGAVTSGLVLVSPPPPLHAEVMKIMVRRKVIAKFLHILNDVHMTVNPDSGLKWSSSFTLQPVLIFPNAFRYQS